LGEVEDAGFAWCGKIAAGGPYCIKHHRRSLRRYEEREPLTEEQRIAFAAWFSRAAGGLRR
jgi:hypothetical protein